MPLIVWTNQMNVGVKLLNNDHKKLVLLINSLHDGLVTGQAKSELESIFERLLHFTRIHHANEEKFLADAGYLGSPLHQHEHEVLIAQLIDLQNSFRDATQLGVEMEILNRLRHWLFKHIQGSDQQYVAHLKEAKVEAILAEWKSTQTMPPLVPASEPRIEQGVW
jgi:hemerythrin-like metal-binding protein